MDEERKLPSLLDVAIIAIFAFFWKSTIRWIVLLVVAVGAWGIVRNIATDVKAHGMGSAFNAEDLRMQANVGDGGRVNWTITNAGSRTAGEIEVTCTDGDGKEAAHLLDDFIPVGASATGEYHDMDVSYDSSCRITGAKAFER